MYEAILWRKNRWEKLVQSFYRIIPHSIFPSALSGLVCKDANDVGFIASLRGDYSSLITLTVRKFYWCSNCFSLPDFTPIAPSHKFPQAVQESSSPSWVFWAKQYRSISFNLSLKSIYMMDAGAVESLQAWRQPLVTALRPHGCLCTDTLVCRDWCSWNVYLRQGPHGTHWPIKHSLANGFLFQLEEKSPPRLITSRKGESIGSAHNHKGGKGSQEVSGLTPIAENGKLWKQTMLYKVCPIESQKPSKPHSPQPFLVTFLNTPFCHWDIVSFSPCQKLILYLVVFSDSFYVWPEMAVVKCVLSFER